jgi:hypothetical protein
MAERLYAQPASTRPAGLGARLRPVLRHRHHRLSLAPRAGEVWGLEIVEEAIADAMANARRNEIDNARFFAGDVRLALRELVERAGAPTCSSSIRRGAGLSAKIVRRIIEAAPTRVVYVSCNPTTLAPNAAQLVEAGYALRRCARSTCSRRRRTSSAWRCWSARRHPGRPGGVRHRTPGENGPCAYGHVQPSLRPSPRPPSPSCPPRQARRASRSSAGGR